MTIITNKDRTIQVKFNYETERIYSNEDDKFYYKIESPIILCDGDIPAKEIQEIQCEINRFVNNFIFKTMYPEKKEATKQTIIEEPSKPGVSKFSDILDRMDKIRKEEENG